MLCEISYQTGEFLRFGRRDPRQVQTTPQAHELQKLLQKGDPFDRHVITIQVMTIAHMSPAHQNAVGPALQSA